jgi:DNA (cytosine-5)-methyltransferase 1
MESQVEYIEMPSGVIVPAHIAEEVFRSWKRPVAIDLFAGAGGMSCGLHQGGFDVLAASEWDCAAAHTYTVNLGSYPMRFHFADDADEQRFEKYLSESMSRAIDKMHDLNIAGSGWIKHHNEGRGCEHFFFGDIRKFTGKHFLDALGMKRGEVDLVAGGPPCQGFSTGGTRNVMDPRNSLVFEFARLVCEIQPKTMVMENVPGIVSMVTEEGLPVIDVLSQILEAGGMGTYEALKHSLGRLGPDVRPIIRGRGRKVKDGTKRPVANETMSLFGDDDEEEAA